MSTRLRVAVIGCGQISRCVHVPDYATTPEAELVALCDANERSATDVAEYWAPGAAVYTDYERLLNEVRPDAVTVAVPNRLHAEVTVAALQSGAHVLVEKPMATSLDEASLMIDAARDADRLLMVNHSQRLYPEYLKARQVVEHGVIGDIWLVTVMFGHAGPEHWSPSGAWFFDREQAAFGAMADLGIHKIDLIHFITGKRVSEISAYTARLEKRHATVEDNMVSALRFDDGALGTMVASWTVKGATSDYMTIHGSRGTLHVKEPGKALTAHLVGAEAPIDFAPPHRVIKYPNSWGIDVSGHFVRGVLGYEPPFCTGEEGRDVLRVILAGARSATLRRSVRVDAVEPALIAGD